MKNISKSNNNMTVNDSTMFLLGVSFFSVQKNVSSPNPTREMRKEEQGSSNQSSAIPELAINHFIHHVFLHMKRRSKWIDGKIHMEIASPIHIRTFPSFPSGKLVSLDLHQES